jgi:gliding motility-associated-like protein
VVDYIDPITVDLGNDTTLCTGDVLLLDATTTGASYEWQNGSTAATLSVSAAGLYWVEIDNGCSTFTDSINVTYVGGTSVDLGNDTSLCAGQTLQLDVFVGGTSYLWQDGSTDSSFTVTTAGIYWVQVGTHCGTTVTDSIEVDYISNITLDLGNDTTLCTGQTLLLNATTPGAVAYEWEDSTTTSTHLVSTAGVYTVEVTGTCNTITESIEVFYIDPVTFDFGHNDTVLCNGDNLVIGQTFPGATYLWQDGSTASTYQITGAGTYWVIAQVSGCTVSDTLNVIYVECNPYLQMPNIFSPNGDGNNDVFRPLFMVNVTSASMAVFNRWGQEVFSTENPMEGWDGNFSGKECVEGTYFWVLTFTGGINNEFTDTRKGTMTLVR